MRARNGAEQQIREKCGERFRMVMRERDMSGTQRKEMVMVLLLSQSSERTKEWYTLAKMINVDAALFVDTCFGVLLV